jgi:hypothetical protein
MANEDIKQRREHLLLRAHEVRLSAETMLDQGCRDTLLAIAASYEAMVHCLEPQIAHLQMAGLVERDCRQDGDTRKKTA